MKKLIFGTMTLFILFALIIVGCNTPAGPGGTEGEGEEVIFDWGDPGYKNGIVFGTDDQWPGYELNLADCPQEGKTGTLGDISLYSNVILTAVLFDREDNEFPVGTDPTTLEAQFHILLDGSSGWGDVNKLASKNNLVLSGDSSASVSKDEGKPGKVLVQARYQSSKADSAQVGYIAIQKVTFVPKIIDMDFSLDVVFGNSVSIKDNKIIFNNASYGDSASGNNWDGIAGVGSAALCIFPESWGTGDDLTGNTITINFTIEEHACSGSNLGHDTEHQLNVQAAQNTPEKELFNGQNPDSSNGNVGQKYITLDSSNETGYNTTTRTGNITLPANDLIAASKRNISGNDGKGPFTLDSVRIANNGTHWEETKSGGTKVQHYRCKSYTLVINSVTIN